MAETNKKTIVFSPQATQLVGGVFLIVTIIHHYILLSVLNILSISISDSKTTLNNNLKNYAKKI
jgi:hypothetical protein